MSRLTPATLASVTLISALVTLTAVVGNPLGGGSQTLTYRLIAAGSLILDVVSAVALGFAIGRGRLGTAGTSRAGIAAQRPVNPASAQAQIEAMTRAETEFLANMSHELRTPLNAVIGFAEIILSQVYGPLGDPRYVEYIKHVHTGGQRLLAIVDATLDLSQLAAGQVALQPCRVEPRAIVEECARSVAAQAEAAKVALEVRPSIAPPLWADPVRLKQALTNLLSNAIKFTGKGGRVRIGASAHDDGVAFEVTDTGIGMTPAEVVVAKQPFRMIEGSMTRRHGGIGLGLPLAERLVRLHGGELRIDSRPGSGTSVTAILPMNASRRAGER